MCFCVNFQMQSSAKVTVAFPLALLVFLTGTEMSNLPKTQQCGSKPLALGEGVYGKGRMLRTDSTC